MAFRNESELKRKEPEEFNKSWNILCLNLDFGLSIKADQGKI